MLDLDHVADETKHSQRAVDRYLKDFHRVRTCYEYMPDIEFITLKRYLEAITYYDKLLELRPQYASAFHDRGLAKINTGDYLGGISDVSKAIELKQSHSEESLDLENASENRAAAYVKSMNYDSAIDDYSKTIGIRFSRVLFVTMLSHIRAIYPEFNNISGKELPEGFRQKYYPNVSSTDFFNNIEKTKNRMRSLCWLETMGVAAMHILAKGVTERLLLNVRAQKPHGVHTLRMIGGSVLVSHWVMSISWIHRLLIFLKAKLSHY